MKRREFLGKSLAGAGLLMGYPLLYGNSAFNELELNYDSAKRYVLKEGDPVPPDELRMLAGYLKTYSVPQGVLQPGGGWTAIYDILTFSSTASYSTADPDNVMSNAVLGQVAITRLKNKNEYIVRMVYEPLRRKEELLARIICNDDAMRSLKSWELDWTSDPVYASHEKGEVSGGILELNDGSHTESYPCNKPLACLWTNMDAVRNLPASRFTTKEFNMYMDLSSLQNSHFLDYSGKRSCPVGNTDMDLTFYRHLGAGINPIHYAVDQQQRTLFVTHGQLGWALNKIVEDSYAGVNLVDETGSLSIYPNPSGSRTYVNAGRAIQGMVNWKITNIRGGVMLSDKMIAHGHELAIDISGLRSGLYILTLENGQRVQTAKFIKE